MTPKLVVPQTFEEVASLVSAVALAILAVTIVTAPLCRKGNLCTGRAGNSFEFRVGVACGCSATFEGTTRNCSCWRGTFRVRDHLRFGKLDRDPAKPPRGRSSSIPSDDPIEDPVGTGRHWRQFDARACCRNALGPGKGTRQA